MAGPDQPLDDTDALAQGELLGIENSNPVDTNSEAGNTLDALLDKAENPGETPPTVKSAEKPDKSAEKPVEEGKTPPRRTNPARNPPKNRPRSPRRVKKHPRRPKTVSRSSTNSSSGPTRARRPATSSRR